MSDLEPLAPRTAISMYLEHRRGELAERTLSTHKYRLRQFVSWLEAEKELENMNHLTSRDLHDYKLHRRDDRGLALSTVKGDFDTLKIALEVWAALDGVAQNLPEKVRVPTVRTGEGVSDERIAHGRAEAILDYLGEYYYASREHVLHVLALRVGLRVGGLRTIDVDDLALDEAPSAMIRHRPDTGTPLKNGESGERDVALSDETAATLAAYIDGPRIEQTDEHGRRPLLTTRHGWLSVGWLREIFYRWSQPCRIDECPHDRERDECVAYGKRESRASQCPSSLAGHAWRTSSITWQLKEGVPPEVVAARVNASEEVIDEYYDKRTHRERMLERREHVAQLEADD